MAFHADFTAVLVETADMKREHAKISRSMEANINLAKQFRANVITLYGDDIVEQIAGLCQEERHFQDCHRQDGEEAAAPPLEAHA